MSSKSRKSEEELQSDQDQALHEANKHVKDLFAILKRETNKLRQEREAFDEAAKKLEHVHFSKTLKLNVGGQLFSTSLETMKKDPGTCCFSSYNYGRSESMYPVQWQRRIFADLHVFLSTRFDVTRHVFRKI